MHILFVHRNFPAQFGHIAAALVATGDYRCTFISEKQAGRIEGIRKLRYAVRGGATETTHPCGVMLENGLWHAEAVYSALKAHADVKPDVVVGHSGLGSTFLLPELYDCPIVNYFEYYYHPHGTDVGARKEFPPDEFAYLRARVRNAMLLLDLQTCDAGYSPTAWQRELFPTEYRDKIEQIHDGIDTEYWRRREQPRAIAGKPVPEGTKIVTYVSRGLESMRGFDIFMRVAKRICEQRSDVIFVVVGSDRVCYGNDLQHIPEKSFREHVLANGDYPLDRILFPGRVPADHLVRLFSLSDLHIYLTVPFVLSWSVLNAMSASCVVLGSDTAPVREAIRDEENGLLAPFDDVEALVERANRVLDDPQEHRATLGAAARRTIEERFSMRVHLPRFAEMLQAVGNRGAIRSQDTFGRVRSSGLDAARVYLRTLPKVS